MAKSQLTEKQLLFLAFLNSQQSLKSLFYLSGGTCLSEYYLHHRYSEDLDFFSENEFIPSDITTLLLQKKKEFGGPQIEYQQSFNRNIYQLNYGPKDILKVEFTYYPFKRIKKTSYNAKSVSIDSLIDIAVNKLFTIYQNPRGRDYYDLFCILKKDKDLSIQQLLKLTRIKFDFPIDLILLGSNFMKVVTLLDDPILIYSIDRLKVEKYFLHEAKIFGKEIVG